MNARKLAGRPDTLQEARALVLRHGWNAMAYQILNPGMRHWFARDRDAVAGYVTHDRWRVVAGAPVCAAERLEEVAAEFEADAAARGERVLFFGAGTRLERVYGARDDHALVRLGAQPTWDPRRWESIVRGKASLRAQLHRARNKGVVVAELGTPTAGELRELRGVLHEWLSTRGLPPLGFVVEPDLLDSIGDRRLFVARRAGEPLAYLVATPVPARDGWLVEQWPRRQRAPNGTTHLLVDAAMRAFAAAGSTYATLGLAPLADRGPDVHDPEPRWLRLGFGWLRAHGRRFYNFRGLEAFKAGMLPDAWDPIFAIAQGPRITPAMLRAVAGVFSGGSPERLVARALLSAAARETRAIAARIPRLASGVR